MGDVIVHTKDGDFIQNPDGSLTPVAPGQKQVVKIGCSCGR